jgi:effector-binding domain-containing protein
LISDEEIKSEVDISYCSVGGFSNLKTEDIFKADNNYYIDFDGFKISSKIDKTKIFSIDNKYDYGVIIKLRNKHHPVRTQICVAGLGESGTTGASWYLANKWKLLLKKVKRNDFGCIIRVEPGKDGTAEIVELITMKDYKELIHK